MLERTTALLAALVWVTVAADRTGSVYTAQVTVAWTAYLGMVVGRAKLYLVG